MGLHLGLKILNLKSPPMSDMFLIEPSLLIQLSVAFHKLRLSKEQLSVTDLRDQDGKDKNHRFLSKLLI